MRVPTQLVPGAFLLLVVGCDDRSDPAGPAAPVPLSASVTCALGVSEADARAEIAALRAEVDALEASGALSSGQAQSLRNHLDNALRQLDMGRTCPALAQLRAFRNQVQSFIDSGVLTDAEARPLYSGIDEVLDGAPTILANTLSAGLAHTCGLSPSGAAYCWGRNNRGQLGDGTTTSASVPTAVAGGHIFAAISAGAEHTCALEPDGTAWCWGRNDLAGLGDGTTEDRATPVQVAGGHRFVTITSGHGTCALNRVGEAFCWGENADGEVGDGTTLARVTPTAVSGGHTFLQIGTSTGTEKHSCGLRADGAVYCWGDNQYGSLGDGTYDDSTVPVPVAGGQQFRVLAVAAYFACALRSSDGTGWCWGGNGYGLGDGSTTQSNTPVAVSGGRSFASISAGGSHACAIETDGDAFCWGGNRGGQLGDGTVDTGFVLTPGEPVAVSGGHVFVEVTAGQGAAEYGHTCGLRIDGAAFCWGGNWEGQLGIGTTGAGSAIPVLVPGWSSLP